MPNIKKFLPAVTEIWVQMDGWMDGETDTQDRLLDSPVVNNYKFLHADAQMQLNSDIMCADIPNWYFTRSIKTNSK